MAALYYDKTTWVLTGGSLAKDKRGTLLLFPPCEAIGKRIDSEPLGLQQRIETQTFSICPPSFKLGLASHRRL